MPEKQSSRPRTAMINVRVSEQQKALIAQAAAREGLQISSFIIMLLVRLHILPDSCLKKLKRRPVPSFNALHALLGIVNKIGGNCRQLALVLPEDSRLARTHAQLVRSAAVLTDALSGQKMREGVNLYRLQEQITENGHAFNQLVKSVNVGRPDLTGLSGVLERLRQDAAAIADILEHRA